MSLRRLLRTSSGLSASALLSPALATPAAFVAARWLGPAAYGQGQAVLLLYMLASLVRSGAFEGGVRAAIHALAVGDEARARRVQNVAVTVETAVSAVPGVLLLAGLLVVEGSVRRSGLILAPIAVVLTSVSGYLSALHAARERFDIVARAAAVRAVVAPVSLLVLIPSAGALAIFLAPMIGDLVAAFYLFRARPRLGLAFDADRTVARDLVRAGFPIGLAAIVYWAYRLVGSSVVAVAGTPAEYGRYAFAALPVTVLSRAVGSTHTVLLPAVWGELSAPTERGFGRPAARVTVTVAMLAGLLTTAGHVAFGPIVHVVAPRFSGSIPLFEVLAGNIVLLSIAAIPSLVLDSPAVNLQRRHLALWVAALGSNLAANVIVLTLGFGPMAVAVNDLWIQAVVVAALFWSARAWLDGWRTAAAGRWLVGIGGVTALVGLCVRLMLPAPESLADLVGSLLARGSIAVVAWSAVGFAYRQWLRTSG
jgi:O-antigen/teichoic acid export membrane protein